MGDANNDRVFVWLKYNEKFEQNYFSDNTKKGSGTKTHNFLNKGCMYLVFIL